MKKSQIFNEVPITRPKRNLFDLSHEVKMSAKFSYLYPVLVQEALPGDTFRNDTTIMMRLAPMLAPIMHRLDVTTHFFFVPYRLLSNVWEDFITGGQEGQDTPTLQYITPANIRVESGGVNSYMLKQTLWDYMGLPVTTAPVAVTSTEHISPFPFQAYQKVWNDYYRDPNFDQETDIGFDTPADISALFVGASVDPFGSDAGIGKLRKRAWAKDYFTSALPWAQRGAQVLLPLSAYGTSIQTAGGGVADPQKYLGTGTNLDDPRQLYTADSFNPMVNGEAARLLVENAETTINDFRTALAIQRWMENNARGGGRYIEQIQVHFATRVPDYRLQRAEYLGGGRQPVQISEVLSTAEGATLPIGEMAGHGISVGRSNRFTYRCQEHGIILGIMSVRPTTAYQQGIDRMWSRTDKFDFAWPEFASLGEQEILSKEVFYSFLAADDDDNNATFGYIPRYAEYKFKQDRVAGDFRDNLRFWHLGRIFTTRPTLGSLFTTTDESGDSADEVTMRRIFAVDDDGTDYLWIDIFHRLTAVRPLPYFGVPRLLG